MNVKYYNLQSTLLKFVTLVELVPLFKTKTFQKLTRVWTPFLSYIFVSGRILRTYLNWDSSKPLRIWITSTPKKNFNSRRSLIGIFVDKDEMRYFMKNVFLPIIIISSIHKPTSWCNFHWCIWWTLRNLTESVETPFARELWRLLYAIVVELAWVHR